MRHRSLIDCVYVRRISLWIIDFASKEQRWSEVDLEFRSPKKSTQKILNRSCNSPDPVRTRDLRNLSLNSQQWNLQLNIRSNLQLNLHLKSQSIPRAQPNSERTTKPSQISAEQLEHAGRVKPFHEIYLKLWRFFICAFNNFRRLACIQIHYFRLLFRQCAVVCLVNCRLPYRSFSPGIECRILNLTTCVCGIPCTFRATLYLLLSPETIVWLHCSDCCPKN